MKTTLNIVDEGQGSKVREVLVRDTKKLKVKTNIRAGSRATKWV